ncbi:MAG TPA: hypothetical protein PKA05_16590, partial [Roseiflexaceae bacterium]|nr:hypothetical protein [Roseiflexaceae bacterium]
MNLTRYRAILAVVVVALLMPLWISTAQAHGRLTVGDYQLVIGFRVEPAYQGEPNGLDLRVTNTRTNEPVLGLAETLRTEISYGGTTRELTLTPRFGQ